MSNLPVTPRTHLRRLPERGSQDRTLIDQILDEGLVCHVSFVHEAHPVVLPMAYVRVDDHIYLHGSTKNRMLDVLGAGAPCCVAVTLLDGLVLARSQFHHSMNYRSVALFAQATDVTESERKALVLAALCDHLVEGRSSESRAPTRQELGGTRVLGLPILEASAKCRRGPALDSAEDLSLPYWAGVLPLTQQAGAPLGDAQLAPGVPTPAILLSHAGTGRAV
jgi:nitroimidazol reductase NimA-like FMN-containing flavoprotein (pyridoxamine 5'-phosphate oxidase superfamily)